MAPLEQRCLVWLATRMPQFVTSDHLTFIGLLSLLGAGIAYWFARYEKCALLGAIMLLGLNWFGDSLDGTLARVRRRERPRYGFYIDHMADSLGALFLLSGLALSHFISPSIVTGLMVVFLLLSIEVYLATYTVGVFEISHWKISPTEARILLAIATLVLFFKPLVTIWGNSYRILDLIGAIGIGGMAVMLSGAVVRHTTALYRIEPPT